MTLAERSKYNGSNDNQHFEKEKLDDKHILFMDKDRVIGVHQGSGLDHETSEMSITAEFKKRYSRQGGEGYFQYEEGINKDDGRNNSDSHKMSSQGNTYSTTRIKSKSLKICSAL